MRDICIQLSCARTCNKKVLTTGDVDYDGDGNDRAMAFCGGLKDAACCRRCDIETNYGFNSKRYTLMLRARVSICSLCVLIKSSERFIVPTRTLEPTLA